MRFFLGLGAKAKRFFLSSPAKERTVSEEIHQVGDFDYTCKSTRASGIGYSEFGSKEEIFFDSKAWIDSDCDDDFFSVNGDISPSRSSTPNYQFTPRRPQLNKSLYFLTSSETKSEHSSTDGKKKLLDLLQESFNSEHADDEPNCFQPNNNQPPTSSEGRPFFSAAHSVYSSEMTLISDANLRKDRRGRAKQCCFPTLVANCSFSDRKKQKMSPVH